MMTVIWIRLDHTKSFSGYRGLKSDWHSAILIPRPRSQPRSQTSDFLFFLLVRIQNQVIVFSPFTKQWRKALERMPYRSSSLFEGRRRASHVGFPYEVTHIFRPFKRLTILHPTH